MARKPMFPNKAEMVRRANTLLVMLAVAPVLYLVVAFLVTFGKPGFEGNPVFVSVFFAVLALVSLANIGFTVFIQTSKKLMSSRASIDPVGRTFHIMSLGAVLSEVHAVYGLALTLVSGSILYGIGFTIVTWASLWWVRKRFKQNSASLPSAPEL